LLDEKELVREKLALNHRETKVIAIRDPNNLAHLHRYLSEPDKADLIALTVRLEKGLASSDGGHIFNEAEEKLFSKIIKVCEDHGRKVVPLVIVSNDQVYAIARAAYQLNAAEVVMGVSARFRPDVQLENFAMHWGTLAEESDHVKVRVLSEQNDIRAEV
jgi:hypothetical protein